MGRGFWKNSHSRINYQYSMREDIRMRIEDHWLDGELYSVQFETMDHMKIQKMIIVPSEGIVDVEEIVRNRFNSVYDVLMIEELDSCLVLKRA